MAEYDELFADIKERLKSPFFSAFLISWIIFNWEIPISLFFYKQEQLTRDGFHSYVHMIKGNYTVWECITLPILMAIAYCVGIKPLLSLLTKLIERVTNRVDNSWANVGTVTNKQYRENEIHYEKMMSDFTTNENERNQKIIALKSQLETKIIDYNQLKTDFDYLRDSENKRIKESDSSILDGRWNAVITENQTSRNVVYSFNGTQVHIDGVQHVLRYFKHEVDYNIISCVIRKAGEIEIEYRLKYTTSPNILEGNFDNALQINLIKVVN